MAEEDAARNGGDSFVLCPFISRSGSTFFFNNLSRQPDIFACPEAEILIYRLYQLLDKTIPPEHTVVKQLAMDMKKDPKLRDWQMDPAKFLDSYSERTGLQLFLTIIAQYKTALKSNARHIFYKGPRKLLLFAEAMPRDVLTKCNIRLMTIVRDGRGAYASQKRSLRPITGRPMQVSPVQAAVEWSDLIERFDRLERAEKVPIFKVRYEQLISDPVTELAGVYDFLGVVAKSAEADDTGDLETRIPGSHRHLHTKIGKPADPSRAVSWKGELSPMEIELFQSVGGPTLQKAGYALERCEQSRLKLAVGELYYWYRDRGQKLGIVVRQLLRQGKIGY